MTKKVNTNSQLIKEILSRGVERVYPSTKSLEKLLLSGKRIRLYNGIDPTGPNLHLGHLVVLRKLKQFQDLGHQVILLIGDFTAQIGDPTDKSAVRQPLSKKQVLANCRDYKKQASKIINFSGVNPVKLKFNSQWQTKLRLDELLKLTSEFTVQQLLERDMFEDRMSWQVRCNECGRLIKTNLHPKIQKLFVDEDLRERPFRLQCSKCGKSLIYTSKDLIEPPNPIYLHEFLYPIMQGYDSVVMDVDLEVGGNDQMFNMLAGRTLMKKMKNKEKCVLTMKLLEDQTGVKMGKTEGNMITLVDKPVEIYGKVMSWTDGMIIPGFEILTEVPLTEITTAKVKKDPMGYKKRLAKELVRELRGDREAQKAEAEFERVFQKKDKPQTMAKVHLKKSEQEINVVDLFIKAKLVASRSEARRLIAQKGLSIDDEIIRDPEFEVTVREGSVLRRGKRHFAQVIFKN